MSDHSQQLRYGGAGDSRSGGLSLADRFRRHADSLVRFGRSPLYVQLMQSAAHDIERGGQVARLFAGSRSSPTSGPTSSTGSTGDHGLPISWETAR